MKKINHQLPITTLRITAHKRVKRTMEHIKLLGLCTLLISCCSNQIELCHSYVVDTQSESAIPISEFVDRVSYIQLEATPASLLSNIKAIYFDQEYIIVPSASTIFFFDGQGKYSHKIDKKGRGNGEYLSMTDVIVDSENDRVLVYDLSAKKMLFYSYEGKFLEAIDNFSQGLYLRDVELLSNGNFLCSEYMHGGGDFKPTAEL